MQQIDATPLQASHPQSNGAAAWPAPTVADVDLEALRHNARVLQHRAGRARLMGVVKADAYGHGAVPVVRTLQAAGVNHFAVATVPEAIHLREHGIDAPILVLAAPLPDALPAYATYALDLTVPTRAVAEAAAAQGGSLRVHVKVDTGMTRLGLPPDEAPDVLRLLRGAPGVTVAALWTHLATADDEDDTFTPVQLDRFDALLRRVDDPTLPVHVANSAALLRRPETYRPYAHAFVRTGIALYGLSTLPSLVEEAGLRPVMRLTSRVTQVRTVAPGTPVSYGCRWRAPHTTRIATVGAGYADGYARALSSRGQVGIRGGRYGVAGTVCMDMFMVDLGPPDGPGGAIDVGDEVVLFGAGGASAMEVAAWAGTIPYELCCRVGPRVPRRYGGAESGRRPLTGEQGDLDRV